MNLKEFFKPDRKKIFYFFITLIIILALGGTTSYYPQCEMGAPCPHYFLVIFPEKVFIIFSVTVSYVIACFIGQKYSWTRPKASVKRHIWKEYFKPDLKKVILALILFCITSFFHYTIKGALYGFPFRFYFGGFCPWFPPSLICPGSWFKFSNLVVDLIFWYFISISIIWIYSKYK